MVVTTLSPTLFFNTTTFFCTTKNIFFLRQYGCKPVTFYFYFKKAQRQKRCLRGVFPVDVLWFWFDCVLCSTVLWGQYGLRWKSHSRGIGWFLKKPKRQKRCLRIDNEQLNTNQKNWYNMWAIWLKMGETVKFCI